MWGSKIKKRTLVANNLWELKIVQIIHKIVELDCVLCFLYESDMLEKWIKGVMTKLWILLELVELLV